MQLANSDLVANSSKIIRDEGRTEEVILSPVAK